MPESLPRPSTPDLVKVARGQVGWEEKRNAAQIIDFFKKNGVEGVDPRVTAWCAAYVDAVLGASGAEQRKSLRAADFATYGDEAKTPGAGNVVVFKPLAAGSSGHVGIVTAIEGDRVRYIGGNDDSKVQESSLPLSKVSAFRMPKGLGGDQSQGFGGLPAQTGVAATSAPMQMPDLSPPAPEQPSETIAQTDFGLGDALKAFSSTFAQAQTPQAAPVSPPRMPDLRPKTPRAVAVSRSAPPEAPQKVDLARIFNV